MGSTTNGLVTYGSYSSGVVESNYAFNGSTDLLTVNGTMNTGTITSSAVYVGELDIQGGKIYLKEKMLAIMVGYYTYLIKIIQT